MRNFFRRLWLSNTFRDILVAAIFRSGIILISFFVLVIVMSIVLGLIPKNINYVDYSRWAVYLGGALVILSALIDRRSLNVRSSSEKEKLETIHRFNVKKEELHLKIIRAPNEDAKKKLEKRALNLRQEYESIMSENLRRRDGTFVTDWRESLLVARKRLVDEEDRLLARNVANLLVGIFMVIIGVGILVYYLIFLNEVGLDGGLLKFLANYGPIVSIVAIIEILAVFFLRLYSQTEHRLEKNKNELTNIELRLTAGLMLYDTKNKDNFAILADTFSKEERNFILGKNESSGGISADKLIEIITKAGATK